MRHSTKIILISSLVLNLLIVSAVTGIAARLWWRGSVPFWGTIPSTIDTRQIAHIIDAIPDDQQAAFHTRLRQLQQDNLHRRAEIARHRRELRTVIADDPFAAPEFLHLSEAIYSVKQQSEQAYALLLRDLLVLTPAKERTRLARRLIRDRRHRGEHGNEHRNDKNRRGD